MTLSQVSLRAHLQACYLVPDLESARTFAAVLGRLESMAPRTKMLADRPEGGEEALSMAGRLEPLHHPLTLARGLVRVFGPVVGYSL